MRAVVQRVARASVTVDGERLVGSIDGPGVVVLVGVAVDDDEAAARWMADRIANLRIFPDDAGVNNHSLVDVGGEALVVSQFTLYGDARKGRRPSYIRAAKGEGAERLYRAVVDNLERASISCATGEFGAAMQVDLVNDGPITILLDSEKTF
jgi:D-tyrosyl-tRNA(Tyr) deacylase